MGEAGKEAGAGVEYWALSGCQTKTQREIKRDRGGGSEEGGKRREGRGGDGERANQTERTAEQEDRISHTFEGRYRSPKLKTTG